MVSHRVVRLIMIVRVIVVTLVCVVMGMIGVLVRMMLRVRVAAHRLVQLFAAHAELRCGDSSACDAFDPHGVGRYRETAQGMPHLRQGHTGVDQRAQQHVPRRARKAVQIQRLHAINHQPSYQSIAEGRRSPIRPSRSSSGRPG
jgi:hypothetical protein